MTGSDGGARGGRSELPPSCKLVLRVLEEADGSRLSRSELLEETDLPESTLDDAIDTLDNCDYILKCRESTDLRQVSIIIRDYPEI